VKTVTTVKEARTAIERWRRNRNSVGFVPTMGALHEGHLSLIRAARENCDRVLVSVFVNPLQFGPTEDYANYPRDLKRDSRLAMAEGADLLFAPTPEEMFPAGFDTRVTVGEKLTQALCGASRPGHFTGVSTIVTKLLILVRAHRAYFGQKDYQQTLIVRRLAEDLNIGTEIVVLPTVREADGLAKSSRNAYLSEEERRTAPAIYQALKLAEGMLQVGERNPKDVLEAIRKRLRSESGIEIEYLCIKNADTLEDLNVLTGRVVVAVAVRLGKTRLIDNIVVDVPAGS
jgi:pantoate--beta-alanine ligase